MQSLNIALWIIDLKAESRIWTFYREKLWFQHIWSNRNDLAIRQAFRADFRMIPDTFMDTITLVRNRLQKQGTRFREAFPIAKKVPIAFRSSHQRCSMKKLFLEISQNSQESTCARVSFSIKLQVSRLQLYLKRDSGTVVFL